MKITIIGTGAYSLGIAMMLSKKSHNKIMLWTESSENEQEFKKTHGLKKIFPNITFADNVLMTTSIEEAIKETSLIFIITSVKYISSVCKDMLPYYKKTPISIASKGIDSTSLKPLSEIVKDILNTKNISVISGPTFAIDLIHNEPVALAIAGNKKCCDLVIKNLANNTLKLRKSTDLIGIELCGSIKNVIAIASGIIDGLGYSNSTQAFLINESLHDLKKIIHSLGGKNKTILSFAGVGDLLLTCTTTKSRNYSFGYLIGSKGEYEEYLKNNTVEGYYTLDSVYKMLKKKGIKIPLINIIYDIVNNKKAPEDLIHFLIKKP